MGSHATALVWTKDGDLEWARCGALKAVIRRIVTGSGTEVGLTVRFIVIGEPNGDFATPAVRHFPAAHAEAAIARLKEILERDLRDRAVEIAVAAARDTERGDRKEQALARTEPSRSPGFYSTQLTTKRTWG